MIVLYISLFEPAEQNNAEWNVKYLYHECHFVCGHVLMDNVYFLV